MPPMRTCILPVLLIACFILCAGCTQSAPTTSDTGKVTGTTTLSTELSKQVRLETSMGTITIALDNEMPITTGHFESLVKTGFYNGVTFHRVMDGFMIQGGDPTGTGFGGSGSPIKDEFTSHNRNDRGTVAMANAGANTGDSQFFINLVNNNYLDNKHPVFGKVVEGMDVVDTIGKVKTTTSYRPVQNVTIIRAEII